ANDVLDITKDIIEPHPEVVDTIKAEYISGVAKIDKRLLLLINLEKVLSPLIYKYTFGYIKRNREHWCRSCSYCIIYPFKQKN
ncbi:chemotaxis protein CheW, partial [Heyndrickxia sporothermodurans]|uniref:chemotaxis protein CheW n=1 Tax=Heyndrickxia sporothermodurans TaxID=46224 RepID=UPI003D3544B7